MKFHITFCVLFLSVATVCFGRLCETEAECTKRYGPPDDANNPVVDGVKLNIYRPKGKEFMVGVTFLNGHAENITFQRMKGGTIAEAEIDLLLEANSQGHKWHLLGYESPWVSWARDDGAGARYRRDFSQLLVIESRAYQMFQKAKENPKVQGF